MKLTIRNFRPIRTAEIDLAPITVVYGPNGAGKSSILYALFILKNVVLNPNQNPVGFFNLGFVSLGSFEAVVYDHQKQNQIELGIELPEPTDNSGRVATSYQVTLGEADGTFNLLAGIGEARVRLKLPVSFPYPANQQIQQSVTLAGRSPSGITWNGITAQVQATGAATPEDQETATRVAADLNAPIEALRKVSMVPLKRGFSKPHYSSVAVSPIVITEDEVATVLSANKYLVSKVSHYLEDILERDFRVNFQPGTAVFSLDSTDKRTGLASELVNEGFGVNQVAYILSRCLYGDTELVCIEEPEIHLHPSAVRRVARALVRIVREEGKRFLISTHSEPFLSALLAMVAKGEAKPADLAFYMVQKKKKSTEIERQKINEDGQIEGGLTTFVEGELEDIRVFFKAKKQG